jgi:hypothetical protein
MSSHAEAKRLCRLRPQNKTAYLQIAVPHDKEVPDLQKKYFWLFLVSF